MKFKNLASMKDHSVTTCPDQGMGQLRTKPDTDSYKKKIPTRPYGGVDYKKHGPKYE